jgi:hypothetical protein
MPEHDDGVRYEVDPDYLEHARREALDELDPDDCPFWTPEHHHNLSLFRS